MKIGELSKQANCKIETIRYYEKITLLPQPARTDSGYRDYDDIHVRRLVFIRRSRELGFTINEIRNLLSLVDSGDYSCNDINAIAIKHIEEIRQKINDLKNLETTLSNISSQCAGNGSPDCAIIDSLYKHASQ
jgi:MerR family mercuric resistance operon transcriptional regulator